MIVGLYALAGRSVLAAILLHTTSNLAWMLFPVMGSHYDPAVTGLVFLAFAVPLVVLARKRAAEPTADP